MQETYGFIHFPLQDHREVQEGLDKVVGEQTYTNMPRISALHNDTQAV